MKMQCNKTKHVQNSVKFFNQKNNKRKKPKLTRSFFSVALVTKEIEMPRVQSVQLSVAYLRLFIYLHLQIGL